MKKDQLRYSVYWDSKNQVYFIHENLNGAHYHEHHAYQDRLLYIDSVEFYQDACIVIDQKSPDYFLRLSAIEEVVTVDSNGHCDIYVDLDWGWYFICDRNDLDFVIPYSEYERYGHIARVPDYKGACAYIDKVRPRYFFDLDFIAKSLSDSQKLERGEVVGYTIDDRMRDAGPTLEVYYRNEVSAIAHFLRKSSVSPAVKRDIENKLKTESMDEWLEGFILLQKNKKLFAGDQEISSFISIHEYGILEVMELDSAQER